ncbi:MAG TPA: efflux RND transporter periplasmic adaptor subunit [Sinorhizobium sp.]|nr:efflux RND transporter periplasmic adaptor subunit [Sinorhizobium sp.]
MSFASIVSRPFAARLLGMAALAALLSGCSEEKAETKEFIRPVKVVEITGTDEARRLDYSGVVKARTEMNLGFRVGGKITERLVNIGDRVKPGDLLARLDQTDYELAVKGAEASLFAAEKQVETTALAKGRAEQLFARKFSSKAQLDQAKLAYDQAVSTRNAAASALDQARNQVAYADLKSDQSGIVTAISADISQVVGTGSPVVTVAVDGEKEVEIAVPEMDISEFRPGRAVKVRFWSDETLTPDGRVREVSGSADRQSRTFSVRISLPDDPDILLGMTATVEMAAAHAQALVAIPLSALAKQDDKDVVWVVDRDTSLVHARAISLADFAGDQVRIAEGLAPGDLVVAAGTQFMTEGLEVKWPAAEQQSARADTREIVR